jgi:hypothetical protein
MRWVTLACKSKLATKGMSSPIKDRTREHRLHG